MKRDMENLNLQDAFKPTPDKCRDALMTAARSVREEEPVRRITVRAVLITACIILATMAIAIAATKTLGWGDFFEIFYGDTERVRKFLLLARGQKGADITSLVSRWVRDSHICAALCHRPKREFYLAVSAGLRLGKGKAPPIWNRSKQHPHLRTPHSISKLLNKSVCATLSDNRHRREAHHGYH